MTKQECSVAMPWAGHNLREERTVQTPHVLCPNQEIRGTAVPVASSALLSLVRQGGRETLPGAVYSVGLRRLGLPQTGPGNLAQGGCMESRLLSNSHQFRLELGILLRLI